MGSRLPLFALLVVFCSGAIVGQLLPGRGPEPRAPGREPEPQTAARPPAPAFAGDLTEGERRDIEIFRHAASAVVNITNVGLRRDFFSFNVFQIPQGAGTGFFWDERGHIVTNFHVIEGASRISVTLADQSDWEAEVVGIAPDKDLAVLRIDVPRERIATLPLGSSAELQVGRKVLALGNPFGLDQTLTVGIVSALGRELQSPAGRTIRDVIQTDAAINPGNSGGPLLDSTGRVVGINTAIYSPSGASAGIGFAVPVDTARRLVPQLIEYGRPVEPGIAGVEWLSDRLAERLRLRGAVVQSVEPRSAAAGLGLEGITLNRRGRYVLGDVVVAVDSRPVESVDDLRDRFEEAGVDARVTLSVERAGRRYELEAQLTAVGQARSPRER